MEVPHLQAPHHVRRRTVLHAGLGAAEQGPDQSAVEGRVQGVRPFPAAAHETAEAAPVPGRQDPGRNQSEHFLADPAVEAGAQEAHSVYTGGTGTVSQAL